MKRTINKGQVMNLMRDSTTSLFRGFVSIQMRFQLLSDSHPAVGKELFRHQWCSSNGNHNGSGVYVEQLLRLRADFPRLRRNKLLIPTADDIIGTTATVMFFYLLCICWEVGAGRWLNRSSIIKNRGWPIAT